MPRSGPKSKYASPLDKAAAIRKQKRLSKQRERDRKRKQAVSEETHDSQTRTVVLYSAKRPAIAESQVRQAIPKDKITRVEISERFLCCDNTIRSRRLPWQPQRIELFDLTQRTPIRALQHAENPLSTEETVEPDLEGDVWEDLESESDWDPGFGVDHGIDSSDSDSEEDNTGTYGKLYRFP